MLAVVVDLIPASGSPVAQDGFALWGDNGQPLGLRYLTTEARFGLTVPPPDDHDEQEEPTGGSGLDGGCASTRRSRTTRCRCSIGPVRSTVLGAEASKGIVLGASCSPASLAGRMPFRLGRDESVSSLALDPRGSEPCVMHRSKPYIWQPESLGSVRIERRSPISIAQAVIKSVMAVVLGCWMERYPR
jgi:hypothetical protein